MSAEEGQPDTSNMEGRGEVKSSLAGLTPELSNNG